MYLAEKPSLLITGATGFVGGSLVQYFNKTPFYRITATGRSALKGKVFKSKGISFQSADLSLPGDLYKFGRPDKIVHSAGLAAPWGVRSDFHKHNIEATKNLLSYALTNGVSRFIYISSATVYSSLRHRYDLTEDQVPTKFVSHYSESKYLAELAVLDAGRKGLPVTILRPRAVIGAGDTTVLPRLIQAHQQGTLRKIGSNQVQTDITTVTNLTEAVRLSLLLPSTTTMNIFNVTDGKPIQLWTMIGELFQELNFKPLKSELSWPMALTLSMASEFFSKFSNREPALPRYVVSLLGRSLTLNIDSARNVLTYNPIQTTEQGVSDYITYFRNQKYSNDRDC